MERQILTFSVRKIVAEVSADNRHSLAILQYSYAVPHHLLLSEGGPAVGSGLGQESSHGSAPRRDEQWAARNRVIKGHLLALSTSLGHVVQESFHSFKVARGLRIVAIEAANAVGVVPVHSPAQIGHHGSFTGSMGLWPHKGLIA